MLSTKTRTTIIALVAASSFAVASVAPAVSQAQWHTYCVSGHCITHSNFTRGGADPCVGINANYNKAYEALLEAIQTKKEQADKVHPEMTQAEAQAKIEEAEAQVHLASIAAFEWVAMSPCTPRRPPSSWRPSARSRGRRRKVVTCRPSA
jgi:Skp family chaperone for outer membrane proteins